VNTRSYVKVIFIILVFLPLVWVVHKNWEIVCLFISSPEAIRDYISQLGIVAPLVVMVAHILQVVFAPIPGAAVAVAAGYLFGPLVGFAVSLISVTIGSLIAFGLARRFGRPLVERLLDGKTIAMLDGFADRHGISGLLIVFLFPFLPDDALCFMAGLTRIHWVLFLAAAVLGRSPGLVVASFTGAGLLDLSLFQWALFAIFMLGIFIIVWRYEEQIHRLILSHLPHNGGGKR